MTRKERIEAALREALAPLSLAVLDESHKHAGHAGARPEGETHFRVNAVSAKFEGQSRVERHRTVYALLAKEQESGLHAIVLDLSAPSEGKAV